MIWTYVWFTGDGPTLGPAFDTEEDALAGAFDEWRRHQGGNLGGYDAGTREEFDAMYAESSDLWVLRLEP